MDNTSWQRQKADVPLFPDMLWSQPENKRARGKLLIIGGNKHAFSNVAKAFAAATAAGAGSLRIVLPDALSKPLGSMIPEADFVPSTISGSFARKSLAGLIDHAAWADAILVAGDLGRNSETAILLDSLLSKYKGPLSISGDGVDYFTANPQRLLGRGDTLVIAEFPRLQKLLAGHRLIKSSMDLAQLVKVLATLTSPSAYITARHGQAIVALSGQVSTTQGAGDDLVSLSAYAAVWAMQQPSRQFEAITSAVYATLKK